MMSKGEETRSRVVDAALSEVSLRGLGAVSIGDVAEASGLSKSGVFKHFQSREALQLAIIEAMAARFKDAVIAPARRLPPGRGRLDALFQHQLDWAAGDHLPGGCPLQAAATELDDQPGPLRDALKAGQISWRETLTREIRELDPVGISPAAAGFAAFQLKGLVLGYTHSRRLLDDPDALALTLAGYDAVLAGLLPQAGPPASARAA